MWQVWKKPGGDGNAKMYHPASKEGNKIIYLFIYVYLFIYSFI
jgi:hypothetical protein